MRRKLLCLITVGVLISSLGFLNIISINFTEIEASPQIGWTAFNHDEKNSRLSESFVPEKVYLKWVNNFDDNAFMLKLGISPPLIAGDKIIVAVEGIPSEHWSVLLGWLLDLLGVPTLPSLPPPPTIWNVYCMDMDNCNIIWQKTFPACDIVLTANSDRVFVGSGGHDNIFWPSGVFCLDINNGKVKWSNIKDIDISSPHGITIVNNKIFIDGGNERKYLYCLNAKNGEEIWKYKISKDIHDHVRGQPAVIDDKVFFTSKNGYLYCIDTDTKKEIWPPCKIGSELTSPAVDNESIYIGAKYQLYCLDQETGNEIWKYPKKPASGYFYAPTLTNGNKLLVYYHPPLLSSEVPRILCIDRNDGSKKWEFEVDREPEPNNKVTATADNKVLVYSKKKLLCLDIATGKTFWEKDIEILDPNGLCVEGICIDSPRLAGGNIFLSLKRSCIFYFDTIMVSLGSEGLPINFDMVSPTTSAPAIVGDPNAPVEFNAKVSTGLDPKYRLFPITFNVKIGEKLADFQIYRTDFDGNYYLKITPPKHDEGSYDLNINATIGGVSDSDIELDAIHYTKNVAVIPVIDRSGSMAWYGKLIHNSKGLLSSEWTKIDTFDIDSSVDTFDIVLETQYEGEESYLRIKSPSGTWYGYDYTNSHSIDYVNDTYIKYNNAEFIGIYQRSDIEIGTWEVYARGSSGGRYSLVVEMPPIRIEKAKDDVRYLLSQMEDQDQIGLVSFADDASLDRALTPLETEKNRDSMESAIDSLNSSGGTALGDGLREAIWELSNRGAFATPVIILFTDGMWNMGVDPIQEANRAKESNIKIYTIGLGNVNHALLREIASITSGNYLYAPSASELGSLYTSIKALMMGESITNSENGEIKESETNEQKTVIDSSISTANFSISWSGSDLDLTLLRPDGSEINPEVAATDPNVKYIIGTSYEIYKIKHPMPGEWTMRIYGKEIAKLEEYTAMITAKTNLTIHIYTNKDQYSLNEPIQIITSLSKAGEPIQEAEVVAIIENPDGIKEHLPLYDDGTHDDNIALDGIYANYYTNTRVSGNYTVTIHASGILSQEMFTRKIKKSLYVSDTPEESISVDLTSWNAGTITPGENTISAFTVSSTSTSNEIIMVSTTDLINDYGDTIRSENVIASPSIYTIPANGSYVFYGIIHIPKNTKSGNYVGNIILTSSMNSISVPIILNVEQGDISDLELLQAIVQWTNSELSDLELLEIISQWAYE
ncbi:MAG: hypothetical protein DRN05_05835 [Thermoplasmata archaeon]|nr:MAG: hypothetical protein DRN05_05835 [Thermoplasmata archaeon]